ADALQPLLEAAHETRTAVSGVVEAALVAHELEEAFERGIRLAHRTAPAHWSTAGAMASRGRTSSTPPARIAAPGIPKYCEVASSCATTWPPACFTAAAPAAPSRPVPERMTAVREPAWFRASDRSRTSALGRTWWTSS